MQAPRNTKLLSLAFVLEIHPCQKTHDLVCFLNHILASWRPLAPAYTLRASKDSPLEQVLPEAGAEEG